MSPLWRFSPLPLLFVHLHLQPLIEICIPTHPWPSNRPCVSHWWREKDLVFSQCTGSQEQYCIIEYSPTKSHQREQRANTYPFEQLRFFIHSGLILFALTLWERFRISVYSYAPTTRSVSFCDRAEATTLSWESIIYLNKGVSLKKKLCCCVGGKV